MIESKCTWCGDMFPEEESYHGICGNCQKEFSLDHKPLGYVLQCQDCYYMKVAVKRLLSLFVPEKYLDGNYHLCSVEIDDKEAVFVNGELFYRENKWHTLFSQRIY